MVIARLTSKGRVVIPKAVRERLHLHAGDRLEFLVQRGGNLVVRPAVGDVNDLYGLLHKPGRPSVSVQDMNAVVHRRARQR